MGFIDKETRAKLPKERSDQERIQSELTQVAVDKFFSENNIALIVNGLSNAAKSAYVHLSHMPLRWVQVAFPDKEFVRELEGLADHEKRTGILFDAVKRSEPRTSAVSIEGMGDTDIGESVTVNAYFDPPLNA